MPFFRKMKRELFLKQPLKSALDGCLSCPLVIDPGHADRQGPEVHFRGEGVQSAVKLLEGKVHVLEDRDEAENEMIEVHLTRKWRMTWMGFQRL